MKSQAIAAVIAENAALIAGLRAEQAKTKSAYGLPSTTEPKK